jgi:hypothetical protein
MELFGASENPIIFQKNLRLMEYFGFLTAPDVIMLSYPVFEKYRTEAASALT